MTWMDQRILGLDTETTGSDPMTCLPVSFALCEFDHGEPVRQRYGLVKPGISISPEATAVHGISDADVEARGGELEATIRGLAKTIEAAVETQVPLCAFNASFDLSLLSETHRRLLGAPLVDDEWLGLVIDPLVLDRHVERYRKGSRKLGAVSDRYGVKLDNAHHAAADAEAAVRVAIAIGRIFPEVGMADLRTLHVLQRSWYAEWHKEFSEYRVSRGEKALDPEDSSWPCRGLTRVPL